MTTTTNSTGIDKAAAGDPIQGSGYGFDMAINAVGRSSFQLVYQVWREGDGALIAAGHSVQVWLSKANRPASLPAAARKALTASLCAELPRLSARG